MISQNLFITIIECINSIFKSLLMKIDNFKFLFKFLLLFFFLLSIFFLFLRFFLKQLDWRNLMFRVAGVCIRFITNAIYTKYSKI